MTQRAIKNDWTIQGPEVLANLTPFRRVICKGGSFEIEHFCQKPLNWNLLLGKYVCLAIRDLRRDTVTQA